MINAHLFRVFTDANGEFGDKTSIIVDDDKHISNLERRALARQLNTVETAFVDDLATASISIMHTQGEIDFAGVPALGAAWLLTKLADQPIEAMKGRAGDIVVLRDDNVIWVRASLATMPPWKHVELDSVEAVERISLKETETWEHTMAWAWINEGKGLIRARTFASDWDIPEAQGNGSGSMLLAAKLNRAIEVTHGDGSIIFAKPASDGCADIGGRVVEEHKKTFQV